MSKFEILGGTLAGMMFLSGCASAAETAMAGTETQEVVVTPIVTQELPTEPLVTATDEVTATVETDFTAEKLAFVPHSAEEISQSVEIASPIDDETGYKEDFAKLKPALDQILASYSGKMITGGDISIDPERGGLMFREGTVLNPIASSHFEWEGYQVPILYFPAEDSQGKFVIGMMLSPTMNDSDYNNNNPAPDWKLSAIVKDFPMVISKGILETRYSNAGVYSGKLTDQDPFFKAYFSGHEDPNYQTVLWNYFLGENGKKLDFDRNYEASLLVVLGGQ
jgi:hypothetical protein